MKDRCNSCGAKVIKNPIWQGQEYGEQFGWNKIIWKNIFKVDFFSISYLVIILFLVWSYTFQIEEYRDIGENPCGFCANAATACIYNRGNFEIDDKFGNLNIVVDPIRTGKTT